MLQLGWLWPCSQILGLNEKGFQRQTLSLIRPHDQKKGKEYFNIDTWRFPNSSFPSKKDKIVHQMYKIPVEITVYTFTERANLHCHLMLV